jgi:hypothetical protein
MTQSPLITAKPALRLSVIAKTPAANLYPARFHSYSQQRECNSGFSLVSAKNYLAL